MFLVKTTTILGRDFLWLLNDGQPHRERSSTADENRNESGHDGGGGPEDKYKANPVLVHYRVTEQGKKTGGFTV